MIRRRLEERNMSKTEQELREVVSILQGSKDFKSLSDCPVLGCFKRAAYILRRIQKDLENVSYEGLLSDTYLDKSALKGDLKDCLDFLTSVRREHLSLSNYRKLIEDLKESISLL